MMPRTGEKKRVKHQPVPQSRAGGPLVRRRYQFLGALVVGALVPYLVRAIFLSDSFYQPASANTLFGNGAAIALAMWMRLSLETYPGIRATYVIFPAALSAHGLVVLFFLLTRFPYERFGLGAGFVLHVLWNYFTYFYAERRIRRRIAIIPFGRVEGLQAIPNIEWILMTEPRFDQSAGCHAIVADFAADLPDKWEAFLAEAAVAGGIVYQVKQLSESLTGRVELQHLSENSFGSLLPARGYFHLKSLADFLLAVLVLPIALPMMALIAVAIYAEDKGTILFRQTRIGHGGRQITVYKFRTMRPVIIANELQAAITCQKDDRITRVGAFLRRTRLDELPQIFNILKREMSWIGPRPEADVLSAWYTRELPFYRYRHVVKPGISGWAQINQGHVAAIDEVHLKLQYDFYYIKYFSPWLDILIVVRTIKTILSGFGAR